MKDKNYDDEKWSIEMEIKKIRDELKIKDHLIGLKIA